MRENLLTITVGILLLASCGDEPSGNHPARESKSNIPEKPLDKPTEKPESQPKISTERFELLFNAGRHHAVFANQSEGLVTREKTLKMAQENLSKPEAEVFMEGFDLVFTDAE